MPLSDGDEDARTILLAISGDVTAFEALVRRYQTYVGALVRRACGDADLADDLTQMTFLKAWQRMRSLREVESFRPWLRRIALNTVVDAARSGAFSTAAFREEPRDDYRTSTEEAIIQRLNVDKALAGLGFAQRTCIVLAYGERMSHSEIAAALGCRSGRSSRTSRAGLRYYELCSATRAK